ncbi:MAG TPA: MBOAT family O-acyltransferase [Pyrinomonadaceae bacterium]|nr:MBOAT family O-acyltransferase [Pyrinomonadaceae bacterium]
MLFTEPLFLFLFLPVLLALYYGLPRRLRNPLLLAASLLFYAFGAGGSTPVLLASILLNYLCGAALARPASGCGRKLVLWLGLAGNLALLGSFKYAGFFVNNLNLVAKAAGLAPFGPPALALPLGVSFFTFMGMSYLFDVYRRQAEPQSRLDNFALYMALFPHLIAGPIVRLPEIARELVGRRVGMDDFAEGVRRFVVGLGKKAIIADTLARAVDPIFAVPTEQLTAGVAWLGIACYTLQIYFDFSGYSDMAVGLARMFGFRFPENFNYPYVAQSVTDFWRRWHITLSTWFRDYVFFPLSVGRWRRRLYLNLLAVFLLCGLWHGAGWGFVIWGLYHGLFLVFERAGLAAWLGRRPAFVRHAYTLLVVMLGWSFFRTASGRRGAEFLAALGGFARGTGAEQHAGMYLNAEVLLALAAGAVGCLPVVPFLRRRYETWNERRAGAAVLLLDSGLRLARSAALGFIFLASAALSAASTYRPFIYFRF